MPSFFQFTQGTESRTRPNDVSPLLGRFRAVPPPPPPRGALNRRPSQLGLLSERLVAAAGRGSVHVGYGALIAAELEGVDDYDDSGYRCGDVQDLDDGPSRWERLWQRWVLDLWVAPRQTAVKNVVDKWWSRYGLLVFLPAVLAVAWCSIPFPQYELPDDDDDDESGDTLGLAGDNLNGIRALAGHRTPGHGAARVQIDFWFFLFVYYGFYNLTALIWITKVFNLYSLNWYA
jgi:hypothetical protein